MEVTEAYQVPQAVERLRRDLKKAALELKAHEARFLVDQYYMIQECRKRGANQERALIESGEPNLILGWVSGTMETIENEIKKALAHYITIEQTGMGAWATGILGIGPVLSAGLLAHIDMNPWHCDVTRDLSDKCHEAEPHKDAICQRRPIQTAASIWRFAGLDPSSEWKKGEIRPWNAALKVVCWKIGQSFEKVSNNPESQYGTLYRQRKSYEWSRNVKGELKDQAIKSAARVAKSTQSYVWYSGKISPTKAMELIRSEDSAALSTMKPTKVGDEIPMLNPGHIRARALRWTVKVFLCHWFEEAYRRNFKKEPPTIYSIAMMGHTKKIEFQS